MEDTKEYLPKSRDFFRKFKNSHFREYFEYMRESRVGPGSGYWRFYRDSEVIQHIRDIVHNLDETFGNVSIPENFTSPKRLVETWQWFREFLISRNQLFENVLNTVEKLPDPFYWIRQIHIDTLGLLEQIMSMDEVKEYISTTKEKEKTDNVHFDIVVITALHDTEFEALKRMPITFTPYPVAHDTTNYLEGKIGQKSILIATDDSMGIAAATSLSTKVIAKFSPSYLIMGGIAAGVKDKEKNYGDILVSRYTWNYESGKYKYNSKTETTIFEPNPEQIELENSIVHIINDMKTDKSLLKTIRDSYIMNPPTDIQPESSLKVFMGPVASGSAVLADQKKIETIRAENRKLIGIDMETFGVFYAAKNFSNTGKTKAISIKSISDFADQRKSDKYRNFAAYTSAQFIYKLILTKLQ